MSQITMCALKQIFTLTMTHCKVNESKRTVVGPRFYHFAAVQPQFVVFKSYRALSIAISFDFFPATLVHYRIAIHTYSTWIWGSDCFTRFFDFNYENSMKVAEIICIFVIQIQTLLGR